MLKKMVTLVLVIAMMLSLSAMVFAEDETGNEDQGVKTERIRVAKEERVKLSKEERIEKLLSLFLDYNPGQYDEMIAAMAEHEAFHTDAKAYFEALREAFKVEKEALKASLENGDISQEDFDAIVAEKREAHAINKEERQVLKAEKQAAVAAIKEEKMIVTSALRQALKAEVVDEVAVQVYLSQLVDLLNQHIEVDQYYFNLATE